METYFNNFMISMTKKEAESMSHSGSCDSDVKAFSETAKAKRQLKKISDSDLIKELSEYGCWTPEQLADRTENEQRILWIAASNISEGR